MGKIVKYCSSCDEGFSEKFSYCPTCSSTLQAFEMNPVVAETPVVEEPAPTAPAFIAETPAEGNGHSEVTDETVDFSDEVDFEYDDEEIVAPEPEVVRPAYAAFAPATVDDGYHITVIEETNGKQRNGLLLAATVFMILFVGAATTYSLFLKPLDLGAIGSENSLAFLAEVEPVPIEEE